MLEFLRLNKRLKVQIAAMRYQIDCLEDYAEGQFIRATVIEAKLEAAKKRIKELEAR